MPCGSTNAQARPVRREAKSGSLYNCIAPENTRASPTGWSTTDVSRIGADCVSDLQDAVLSNGDHTLTGPMPQTYLGTSAAH